jgi:hypothetical protein
MCRPGFHQSRYRYPLAIHESRRYREHVHYRGRVPRYHFLNLLGAVSASEKKYLGV